MVDITSQLKVLLVQPWLGLISKILKCRQFLDINSVLSQTVVKNKNDELVWFICYDL